MTTITRISKDKGEFYLLWLSSGEKTACLGRYFSTAASAKRPRLSDTLIEEIKKASSYDVGYKWR